jgi:hypothetical protein
LLGAQQPAETQNQNNALEVVAPPDRRDGAHRRGALPSLFVQRLARSSRAARALAEARRDLVRGVDSRHVCLGQQSGARNLSPRRVRHAGLCTGGA